MFTNYMRPNGLLSVYFTRDAVTSSHVGTCRRVLSYPVNYSIYWTKDLSTRHQHSFFGVVPVSERSDG